MRIEADKRLIGLNVGLVAHDQHLAEKFCTAMAVLMDVPERLPAVKGVTAPQTGGRVDPAKNTVNKVIHQVLGGAVNDPKWSFELYFTALTPEANDAMQKAKLDSVRGTLDAFVLVNEQSVATTDPGNYLHPVLSACAPRLTALRKQLAGTK